MRSNFLQMVKTAFIFTSGRAFFAIKKTYMHKLRIQHSATALSVLISYMLLQSPPRLPQVTHHMILNPYKRDYWKCLVFRKSFHWFIDLFVDMNMAFSFLTFLKFSCNQSSASFCFDLNSSLSVGRWFVRSVFCTFPHSLLLQLKYALIKCSAQVRADTAQYGEVNTMVICSLTCLSALVFPTLDFFFQFFPTFSSFTSSFSFICATFVFLFPLKAQNKFYNERITFRAFSGGSWGLGAFVGCPLISGFGSWLLQSGYQSDTRYWASSCTFICIRGTLRKEICYLLST